MLATMRTVLLKLPESARPPLGETAAFTRPFGDFAASALRLSCPFTISQAPVLPFPPRGGRSRAA